MTRRILYIIIAVLGAAILATFVVNHIRKQATEATTKRVGRGQVGAGVESAKDAIATQGAAAKREQEATQQEKTNADDIKAAEGAPDRINPAARDAFLRAQCLRDSFRNTRVGKLRCAPPAGVEGGRP